MHSLVHIMQTTRTLPYLHPSADTQLQAGLTRPACHGQLKDQDVTFPDDRAHTIYQTSGHRMCDSIVP